MELFARRCDVTGQGMNEGWVTESFYLWYFANEEDAVKWVLANGYDSLDDAYEDEAVYWTAWEDDEDKQYGDLGRGLVEVVVGEYSGYLGGGDLSWEDEDGITRVCSGQFNVVDGWYVHDMVNYIVIAK